MAILRKENVTLHENDPSKIKELEAIGYEKVGKDGKVIAAKQEETVSVEEYEELKKENTALKGQVTKLENAAKKEDKK